MQQGLATQPITIDISFVTYSIDSEGDSHSPWLLHSGTAPSFMHPL